MESQGKQRKVDDNESFKIKTYGFGQLALMYFPDTTKKNASTNLKNWINYNPLLKSELKKVGWKKRNRLLTPRQVSILIQYLGEP